MADKIKVAGYTRTLPDGSEVQVAGYERMKSTPAERDRHRGNIDTMAAGDPGNKIVTRDPDRHGKVQTRNVEVLGRPGIGGGVTRVSR